MSDTDPLDAPELEYLGAVEPGKSYLLRATEPLQPQDGMRVREQLERTFPGSTFAILSHNLETLEPKPATELLTVLRDTALKYQKLATKMEPGPSRAAAQIVGNALLDVWHALTTTQAEEVPEEPAPDTPKPAECHESPFDGASECTLPAYHSNKLHRDAYGNRWSW